MKTEEFSPGHVGFLKQGYGHYIEQIGDEPTGGNPNSLLTTNFGIQKDQLDLLPKKEMGILGRRG